MPRRNLPGPRVLIGAFLVTIAALGAFLAVNGIGGDGRHSYVVAAHDIAPGARVSPTDLRTARLTLSPDVASHAASSATELSGSVVLGPIKSGELVQTGNLITTGPAGSTTPQPQLSFALPASRALDGSLHSGEQVDIIATSKSDSTTRTVVSGATVAKVSQGSSASSHSGDTVVTVSIASHIDAETLVNAVDQGQVTLVRTTGSR